MTFVHYIGTAQYRKVSTLDWMANGVTGNAVEWSIWNGWSVPTAQFTNGQLTILDSDSDFLLDQTSATRQNPPYVPDSRVGRESVYLYQIIDIYQKILALDPGAGGGPSIYATKAELDALKGAAPAKWDTLAEIAAELSADDAAFVTLQNLVTGKVNQSTYDTAITNINQTLGLKADSSTMTAALGQKANASDVASALALKSDSNHTHTKAQIGLSNVDNTSDLLKPLSNADVSALAGKAAATHSHSTTDILDLAEFTQDTTAGLLKAGSGVTLTYDDAANTLTINSTATGGTTDPEIVRDTIGGALVAGSGIQIVVDDAGDIITFSVTNVPMAAISGLNTALAGKSNTGHTHVKSEVGLGSVDNTADNIKAVLSATKLATARKINGIDFDGTGDITLPASASKTGIDTAAWNLALSRRFDRPVSIVTFADSRGDGTKPPAATNGVAWDQTFPQEFANQLRGSLGLNSGGRGYLPMQRSGADNTYQYTGPSLVSGSWSPIVGDTGIPGSQWIVPVGDGGRVIRIPLKPGCTSVDLISASGGVHYVQMTGQSGAYYQDSATAPGGANSDTVQFTKLRNPGSYVDVTSPGGGWQALGMIEYCGDETSGIRSWNFATAGITANDYALGVVKAPFAALLAKIAADMTVVEVSVNDVLAGRTPAQIVSSIQTLLTSSGGQRVILTPIPTTEIATANGNAVAAIKQISANIVDLAAMGADTSSAAYAGWFLSDLTHLTRAGALGYADATRKTVLGSTGVSRTLDAYQIRSAGLCFEMCSTTQTVAANYGFQQRRPFRASLRASKFRFHVKNRVHLGDAYVTGTIGQINNFVMWIGKPAVDATSGEMAGNWLAAPLQIQSSTTIASSTELITPWVDQSVYDMNIDRVHQLGVAFNAANVASAQVALSGGFSFSNQTPGDIAVLAPTTALVRSDNAAHLQIIMEYEHADTGAIHMLVIGNSLSGASANASATPIPQTNVGEMATWHQQWAQRERSAASSLAVAGSYSAHFISGNTRLDQFDTFDRAYVPDAVLYMGAASSDIADCTTSSTSAAVKDNVRNMVRRGRAKFPGAKRHYLTDIPPRNNFTGSTATNTTNEYWRNDLNMWMHNYLPMQVDGCLDIDGILSDRANPARLQAKYTTEGVHWNVWAHTAVQPAIPLRRVAAVV